MVNDDTQAPPGSVTLSQSRRPPAPGQGPDEDRTLALAALERSRRGVLRCSVVPVRRTHRSRKSRVIMRLKTKVLPRMPGCDTYSSAVTSRARLSGQNPGTPSVIDRSAAQV